jgi:diacylglycerol kinase family enzyme
VVQQVLGSGRPLAVLPQGTFNFFGRSHHISEDTATAARGALQRPAQQVQVGLVNGRVFLVNASLGLYPQILQDREGYKQRYGRSRWVALWSGLQTILRGHRNLRLQLQVGEQQRVVHSPTLVIDNNRLQLEKIGVEQAVRVEHGELVAIAVKPVSTREMLWLAVRGVLGRLGDADRVDIFNFRKLRVEPRMRYGQRTIKVAVDGEILRLRTPLTFEVSSEPLHLLGVGSAADDDAQAAD